MPYARQQPNRLVLMPACSFPQPLEQQWDNSTISIPFNNAVKTIFCQEDSIVASFFVKVSQNIKIFKLVWEIYELLNEAIRAEYLLQGTG